MELALLILSILLNVACIALLAFLILKQKGGIQIAEIEALFEKRDKKMLEEMSRNRTEAAESERRLREEISNSFKGLSDTTDRRMREFADNQNKNIETIKSAVEQKLNLIQKDNSEKLEAMRATVDEKLHATLEKRLGDSFAQVSKRLEEVHTGLGEMKSLASGVGDLKKILSNIKSRGTWGESQLQNLIEEILTPEQYEKNINTKGEGNNRVEFAVRLPGDENIPQVWLPIDAKFPLEAYGRLIKAEEDGDLNAIAESKKELEKTIKKEAQTIAEKYLNPPNTTNFGILFLPTESLFAEILRIPGLFEQIRRDFRVIIAGPTTTQVILNSLRVGFRTLALQKQTGEIWQVLETVKNEFGKFGGLLEKTHKKIQEAGNTIEGAVKNTKKIEKQLNTVTSLSDTITEKPLAIEEHSPEN